MRNTRQTLYPLIALLFLVGALLACGGRTFTGTMVYALDSGSQDQFHDPQTDTILAENVWVFRPDGSYQANLNVGQQPIQLTGRYGGDSTGDGFYLFFDIDGNGEYDDQVLLSEDNSYLEWQHEGTTYRFIEAP